MPSFATIVAASAAFAVVLGSPLNARSNTCSVVPSGSDSSHQPLAQPSNIKTAADCKTQCDAQSGCQSFCFGMVDNVVKCELFSVPAASIPKQSSSNLIAYDKGCDSVPSVQPTASNPTGKADGQTSNQNQNTGKTVTQKQASSANSCGAKPAANTSNQPLSQPSGIKTAADCKAQCSAKSDCKSFVCGEVDNAFVCKLYSVAASAVPAPTNADQKNALVAYDIGCSI